MTTQFIIDILAHINTRGHQPMKQRNTNRKELELLANNLYTQLTKLHQDNLPDNWVQTLQEFNSFMHKKQSVGKPKVITRQRASHAVKSFPESAIKDLLIHWLSNLDFAYYSKLGYDPLNPSTLVLCQEFYRYNKLGEPLFGDLCIVSSIQFVGAVNDLEQIKEQEQLARELHNHE